MRMEAVDILVIGDCIQHPRLVDVGGKRQLNQQTVHIWVGIQLRDFLRVWVRRRERSGKKIEYPQQIFLTNGFWQFFLEKFYSSFLCSCSSRVRS